MNRLKKIGVRLLIVMGSGLVVGSVQGAPAPPPLANVVILIVRHAEKPETGAGLTDAGRQRASAYVRYFKHYKIGAVTLHLDHLIATADTAHSRRPRLTLEPLSLALHLPLDTRFQDHNSAALISSLQSDPGGKRILICWHHGEIAELLTDLGADPKAVLPHGKWPADVYDWVIQLHYDRHGKLLPGQTRRIRERLMPGDETTLP